MRKMLREEKSEQKVCALTHAGKLGLVENQVHKHEQLFIHYLFFLPLVVTQNGLPLFVCSCVFVFSYVCVCVCACAVL